MLKSLVVACSCFCECFHRSRHAICFCDQIFLRGSLNFESIEEFVLPVVVTDSGVPPSQSQSKYSMGNIGSLSYSASLVVKVVDVNEKPAITSRVGTVSENATIGSPVLTLTPSDVELERELKLGLSPTVIFNFELVDQPEEVAALFCSAADGCASSSGTSTWSHKVYEFGSYPMPVSSVTVKTANARKLFHGTSLWIGQYGGSQRLNAPYSGLCGDFSSSSDAGGSLTVTCSVSTLRGRFLHFVSAGSTAVMSTVLVTTRLPFSVGSSGEVTVNAQLDFEYVSSYNIMVLGCMLYCVVTECFVDSSFSDAGASHGWL